MRLRVRFAALAKLGKKRRVSMPRAMGRSMSRMFCTRSVPMGRLSSVLASALT